ncbi:MAG: alpha/beta fold hydrolase, partial [Nanoarchaeota archaeon]
MAGTIISGDLYLKDVNYKPKVGIIAMHGVNDSKRVYYSLGVRVANIGFLVYCPDLPSHGHPSEGIFRFGVTSESMLLVIRHLKKNYGVEKIGVVAWSLGSMVALFELMHYTVAIEEYLEKLKITESKNANIDSLKSASTSEMRSLILSEYGKYEDCRIDAILLLTPVDYTQIAFSLRKIDKLMGKKFTLFVKALIFLGYRGSLRGFFEEKPDTTNPPGTRFYFRKNPHILAVKDSGEGESFYRKLLKKLKLGKLEDPIQARA